MLLDLTSDVMPKGKIYDYASSILAQKLAQVSGVGQASVSGGALPGVRIELNPTVLNKYGIGLEQVRGVLSNANANEPKGHFSDGLRMWEVGANDQLFHASDYRPLIVAYKQGSPVRLSDVAEVVDAPESLRSSGYANGKPSVLVILFRQPGANIIDTVDRIRAMLPQLKADIPPTIDMRVAMDQTLTIRASVHDTERTLIISVLLVILVVFVFLRNVRTTFIPSVAVPVSLVGTFGVMYLLGYSLDNLSLMALCISTGFVVDDAIVVIENISRYLEKGMAPFQAALQGAQGDWLHRADHQRFAGGGLHSPAADGRNCGPAVSRVRRDPVGGYRRIHGGLAHRDPFHVRAPAAAARIPWLDVSNLRARLQRGGELLWQDLGRRAALSGDYPDGIIGDHRAERIPLHPRSQGVLSAAG